MRTSRHLFDRLVSMGNLRAAWQEARRRKRRRPDVAAFEVRADDEVVALSDELASGLWRPRPASLHLIREPKPRLISAAPFRDRVVHHALHRVVEPIVSRRFLPDSFACRPGMGTHRAVLRFQQGLRRHPWVGRLDVRRYYLEIDWDILLGLVGRSIGDRRVLQLLERVLEAGGGLYADAELLEVLGLLGDYEPRHRKGVPIGNLPSQLFGNLYLDGLDHFAKRDLKVPAYVRYMDDFALFGPNRKLVRSWCEACADWLWEHRGLEVRPADGNVAPTSGTFRFLGHVLSRDDRRVAGRTVRRLLARVRSAAREGASEAELRRVEQAVVTMLRGLIW